jgi:hypothetical protein
MCRAANSASLRKGQPCPLVASIVCQFIYKLVKKKNFRYVDKDISNDTKT